MKCLRLITLGILLAVSAQANPLDCATLVEGKLTEVTEKWEVEQLEKLYVRCSGQSEAYTLLASREINAGNAARLYEKAADVNNAILGILNVTEAKKKALIQENKAPQQ